MEQGPKHDRLDSFGTCTPSLNLKPLRRSPMYSESSDISFPTGGGRLLSESPLLPSASSSQTGHGGDDLSLSELCLSENTAIFQQPFSLLARPDQAQNPQSGPSTPTRTHSILEDDDLDDDGVAEEEAEKNKRASGKLREEKLQSDIFILKKLNASFALFNDALEDTQSANERVASQLEQTDALLNKYIGILSKSEDFARLIFDEQWQGAEEDEAILEKERIEAEEMARREKEERILAARRERERLEQEEKEKAEKEEKARVERERKERAANRGGVRGVRGTRASASMRGSRGTAPGRGTVKTVSGIKRPTSAASYRASTPGTSSTGISGIARRT